MSCYELRVCQQLKLISKGYDITTKASDIAAFLPSPLNGEDIVVNAPPLLQSAFISFLIFANTYSETTLLALKRLEGFCALVIERFRVNLSCSCIVVDNPWFAFAQAATHFFVPPSVPRIASTAIIRNNVIKGARISIGDFTVDSYNTIIGDRSVIMLLSPLAFKSGRVD